MPLFQKSPEKLEAKALDYERRGKTAKALKYREKAARMRSGGLPSMYSHMCAIVIIVCVVGVVLLSFYVLWQRYLGAQVP